MARTAAGAASGDGRSGQASPAAGPSEAPGVPQPVPSPGTPPQRRLAPARRSLTCVSSPEGGQGHPPASAAGSRRGAEDAGLNGPYALLAACLGSGPGPPGVPPAGDLLGTFAFPSPSLPYHRAQRSHAVQPTGQTPPPLRTRGVQERTGHVPPPPATPKLSASPPPGLRLLPAPGPTVKKHVCSGAPPTGCNAIHRSKRLPG